MSPGIGGDELRSEDMCRRTCCTLSLNSLDQYVEVSKTLLPISIVEIYSIAVRITIFGFAKITTKMHV